MKVAVFQIEPRLLDVQANLDQVVDKLRLARESGVGLAVFPELCLTGYFVSHRYHEVALRLDSPQIRRLVAATKGTAAVVGFIEESPSMNFYNSALVAVDGEIRFAARKLNLPNYGVFEERKYFSPGKRVFLFRLHGFSLAVFICNDLWHPSLPYLGVCQKADVFVTVFNSSETSMGDEFSNIETWGIINSFYSRVFGVYNICANRVGSESPGQWRNQGQTEDLPLIEDPEAAGRRERYDFWGGSEIINPYGQSIAKAKLRHPDEIHGEISRDILRKKRILLPYLRNDDPYFTHRELQRILYEEKWSGLPEQRQRLIEANKDFKEG